MLRTLKDTLNGILAASGYELCRPSPLEGEWQQRHGWNGNYKNLQLVRGLATTSQLSLAEARFLADLVRASDPTRPIIEIGTLFGWSTLVIALAKPKEQRLITVDNYSWNPLGMTPEAHYMATRLRLAEAVEHYNVHQIKMDKDEFYRQYEGPQPALFFCDADHGYAATKADLEWARSVAADVICGDDYSPGKFPGVVQAVQEMGGAKTVVDEFFAL